MTLSSRGGIPLLQFNQSSPYLSHNEAIEKISAIGVGGVTGYNTDSPPGSPVEGSLYVIGSSPTGVWTNYSKHLAHYLNGTWEFYAPFSGLYTLEITTGKFVYYNGSSWGYTN